MFPDHWSMFLVAVATVLSLAWSAARLRTTMRQETHATQQFLRDALQPLQESNERIALMVRELHNR